MQVRIAEAGNASNNLKIDGLTKPDLPCVVSFYRSKKHAEGKYGKDDPLYKGEYGFDRFDEDVMAEGLVNEYDFVKGVEADEEVVDGDHRHPCSYISLYPPNPDGNISKAKVTVRLQKSKKYERGDPNFGMIHFESSDPSSVQIVSPVKDSLSTLILTMESRDDTTNSAIAFGELEIECLKEFPSQVSITAIRRVKNKKDRVVGKLIVYPNAKRYTTVIQPIVVKLGLTTSDSKTDVPSATMPVIQAIKLEQMLNQNSLNQALIHSKVATNTHTFTFNQSKLSKYIQSEGGKNYLMKDDNLRQEFNTYIENQYALLLGDTSTAEEETKKNKAYNDSGMHEAFQNFRKVFHSKFGYDTDPRSPFKEARSAFNETFKIVDKKTGVKLNKTGLTGYAFNHRRVKAAYNECLAAETRMNQLLKNWGIDTTKEKGLHASGIEKKGLIHVFYYPDIEAAYSDNTNTAVDKPLVPGYTSTGNGVSHIFNKGFSIVDAIIHEIGHGLGLPHPFAKSLGRAKDPTIKTKEDYEKELDLAEKELEKFKTQKEQFDKGMASMKEEGITDLKVYSQYSELHKKYKQLKGDTDVSALSARSRVFGLNKYATYTYYKYIIDKIKELLVIEGDINLITIGITDGIEKIKSKITAKDSEVKLLNVKMQSAPRTRDVEGEAKYQSQSRSLENYMDYDFYASSGRKNTDFERKSLTYLQWKIIWDKGRTYLKPLK